MKIALIGYGKMGKEIEKIALERNHEIVLKIDINSVNEFTLDNLKNADVAIEFTRPETAFENYKKCFEADLPVISGTTGWLEKKHELEKIVLDQNKTFFYASNFSIGVNIVFKVNELLAKLMNKQTQYFTQITEIHHIHKLDKPSGTAVTLAEQIIEESTNLKSWTLDNYDNYDELPIFSKREGEVPGTHIITYDSEEDSISLIHEAKNRKGFALGAVLAAEFSIDKKGILSMNDLFKL